MSNRPLYLDDLFPGYDPNSQLVEIELMLTELFTWRNALHGDISEHEWDLERETVGTDEHGLAHAKRAESMEHSCYRDTACSHAAVGALAPFIEGLLAHMFQFLRRIAGKGADSGHERWKLEAEDFWDPHKIIEDGNLGKNHDIVRGTIQLVEALDIGCYFPHPFNKVLAALFTFRNRALHDGYDWPPKKRAEFAKLVEKSDWRSWFGWPQIGGVPWMISLNDVFVRDCLQMAQDVLCGFERLSREWQSNGTKCG